eukprot:20747-Heterococcus_DN1.PRE.2
MHEATPTTARTVIQCYSSVLGRLTLAALHCEATVCSCCDHIAVHQHERCEALQAYRVICFLVVQSKAVLLPVCVNAVTGVPELLTVAV